MQSTAESGYWIPAFAGMTMDGGANSNAGLMLTVSRDLRIDARAVRHSFSSLRTRQHKSSETSLCLLGFPQPIEIITSNIVYPPHLGAAVSWMPFLPARGRQRTDRSWVAGTGDQAGLRPNGPVAWSGGSLKPKAPRVTDVGQPGQRGDGSGRIDSPPRSPQWHADGNRSTRRDAWDRPSGRRDALPLTQPTQFARQVRRACHPVAFPTDHLPKRRRQASRRSSCWSRSSAPCLERDTEETRLMTNLSGLPSRTQRSEDPGSVLISMQ